MARALVVDPDRFGANVFRCILDELGLDATLVGTAREALDVFRPDAFDFIVLEAKLPDRDGIEFAVELRGRRYHGPLVFISAKAELRDLLRGYAAGADDYIVKPYEPAEIVAKVGAIMRRCSAADAQPLGARVRVGDAELNVGTLTYSSPAAGSAQLSATELRILECLMRNPAVVIGRDTLIERVWGYDFEGESNRVDVYIRRVRRKIEPDPERPCYLHTVRGLGYVFRPDADQSHMRAADDLQSCA